MTELKTKATGASVDAYLDARASDAQRADCTALIALFTRLTQQPPVLWGPSIVGHGRYRYTYESGRSGEMPLVGFAIRGRDLVVYIDAEAPEQQARLARLGKHKMGKSCLYFKRLADVDAGVLEELVAASIARVQQRYGSA